MLPKKLRANKKMVEAVFKNGRSIHSANLSFKFTLDNASKAKNISFVAPKSVSKLATKRNALRRRGYLALRDEINKFPEGLIGVFIFKKSSPTTNEIRADILFILGKL